MDTPPFSSLSSTPNPSAAMPNIGARRWLRVALFVGLILLAQGTLAFLLTWVDPPRETLYRAIDLSQGHTHFTPDAWLAGHEVRPYPTKASKPLVSRKDAQASLAEFAKCGANQPLVLVVRAPAVQAESGHLILLPHDAAPDDLSTGLRLRDVLKQLKACPSHQKLLVLDLAPPAPSAWRGHVHHNLGTAIARELDALPDPGRLVLCSCAAGQTPYGSPDLGQSVFAHYLEEGLRGHADGYGANRDGRITVKELAAFVQARVERWTWHNRGDRQTPTLLGDASDFVIASVDPHAPPESAPNPIAREHPETLQWLWKERDTFYQTGRYPLASRRFQYRQARLQFVSRNDAAKVMASNLAWMRPPSGTSLDRAKLFAVMNAAQTPIAENAKNSFDEKWRVLQQQLADTRPTDAERIKNRFIEQMHGAAPGAELDAVVFAQAVADPRLDPGTLRLYDQLLHPTPQTLPRTAEGLRLRQLADLAMRVEVLAWPRDLVEAFLRCAELGEKAQRQFPYMPGYVNLLDEPMQARHDGEVRLLTRGYANPDEAKKSLTAASKQFEQLIKINERWRACEQVLDEALVDLPWYFEALEAMPELREHWLGAADAAAGLAATLEAKPSAKDWWFQTERQHTQVQQAGAAVVALRKGLEMLREPLTKDALAQLDRQCRAPEANAQVLRKAEAILSVAGPALPAGRRITLWKSALALSRRLNDEVMAQDRQDNELQRPTPFVENRKPNDEDESQRAESRSRCQLALLALAGVGDESLRPLRQKLERCQKEPNNPVPWCELGTRFTQVMAKDMPALYDQENSWRRRERLAWLMSPWEITGADRALISPTAEHRSLDQERQARWRADHQRYLARAFQTLNLESAGIVAARSFYAQGSAKHAVGAEAQVRFALTSAVEPLTQKQPYSHVWLEVTRQVPPGAFGPLELQIHRPDDVWLEAAPESATLPALLNSKEPRTLTHKVPLKLTRLPGAERTGLPPPLGVLIEARCDGKSWHHLVTAPIVPNTQLVQILISADPDEPAATLNDIRIRPGKVKQPHYFYVRNLTNRAQKVHVEIKAGEVLLHKSQKPLLVEPDGVRKILFDEAAGQITSLRGPLVMRVLDQDRQKVLHEKSMRVEVLPPSEYVKVAEATYDPGSGGNNRWAVQVQAARPVAGPAIAAQLVLPAQRIPGLLGVGGGTLHADVPAQAETPRVLFAENIRLTYAGQEEGPVYLHIDGVPRAFVYRTTFARAGDPTQARPDERPAVRIAAPPCVMSGVNCLVDVEVDNAAPGTKLEVALGRPDNNGGFKAELVREFTDAKKCRIDVETAKDALVFNGSIADWTATFDTRNIVGARDLQASLIDRAGKVIAQVRQPIVIDDSPPLARIVPLPAQAKKGSVLQVQAEGTDPESGIAQVIFFFGRPDKGEVPPGVPRFKGIPATRDRSFWMAALLIPPDYNGPLAISVQVVNHAGLASIDTVTLEITEREPGKTGLGQIHGKVTEGPRPQPNLLVTLLDQNGTEIGRTRTQADGSYAFGQLVPGRYRVICVKPESQRRAVLDVPVEPDRPVRADLALAL
jgi:hypothetical protein